MPPKRQRRVGGVRRRGSGQPSSLKRVGHFLQIADDQVGLETQIIKGLAVAADPDGWKTEVLCRHLSEFSPNDLTTFKRNMADLSGVRFAGAGPA